MYGFPPITLKSDNKKLSIQREYVQKSYVNIRKILYNKKKNIEKNINSDINNINIVESL